MTTHFGCRFPRTSDESMTCKRPGYVPSEQFDVQFYILEARLAANLELQALDEGAMKRLADVL